MRSYDRFPNIRETMKSHCLTKEKVWNIIVIVFICYFLFFSGFVFHVVFKYPKITRRKKEQNAGMDRTALPFQKTERKENTQNWSILRQTGNKRKIRGYCWLRQLQQILFLLFSRGIRCNKRNKIYTDDGILIPCEDGRWSSVYFW